MEHPKEKSAGSWTLGLELHAVVWIREVGLESVTVYMVVEATSMMRLLR